MNKKTFCEILECALLGYDGYDHKKLCENGFNPLIVSIGIKLCDYLKSIEVQK